MPFISFNTSLKLEAPLQDELKTELGKIITIIPGKSESVLMIAMNDELPMYYGGSKKEKCAFIEFKTRGSVDREHKEKLIARTFELMEKLLDIPGGDVFVTVTEYADWGFQGKLK